MTMHLPVMTGGAEDLALRPSVESLLTDNSRLVNERLSHLDGIARAAGFRATFGAEVECQFLANPTTNPSGRVPDKERLYEEVLLELLGDSGPPKPTGKGDVVTPLAHPEAVMLNAHARNTYYTDTLDCEVSEVRTGPAPWQEALDRYWNTIMAIGKVGARHGCVGVVLSTHISAAVWRDVPDREPGFVEFGSYIGGKLLAAVQHATQALRPLQIDAGLEEGIVVNEAFPSKDVKTAVHRRRLEFRHPLVAAVDPRIDMLGVLAGLDQLINNAISRTAMSDLRTCASVRFEGPQEIEALNGRVVCDRDNRMVMPAELQTFAVQPEVNGHLDQLVAYATHGIEQNHLNDNSRALRGLVGAMRLHYGTIEVDPDSPYASKLREVVRPASYELTPSHRVVPEVEYDSPADHLKRRQGLAHSSIVRGIMGGALLKALTPADESVRRRADLLAGQMLAFDRL